MNCRIKLNKILKISLLYLCSCWSLYFPMLWLNEANAAHSGMQGCLTQFPCIPLHGLTQFPCMARAAIQRRAGRQPMPSAIQPQPLHVYLYLYLCSSYLQPMQSALQFPHSAIEAGIYWHSKQRTIM